MSEILCWDHPIREPDCPKCQAEDYPPMTTIKEGDELARELEAQIERTKRDCPNAPYVPLNAATADRILTALRSQHNGATQLHDAGKALCAAIDKARNMVPDDNEELAADIFALCLNKAQMDYQRIARAALSTSSPSGGMVHE